MLSTTSLHFQQPLNLPVLYFPLIYSQFLQLFPSKMAMTTGGIVAVVIICILYFGFLFTASALIIKNKMRFRRNKKRLLAASEYQALQSDIELEEQPGPKKDDNNMIPQLPTDDDGGEDLKGKPKLEFEGNPLHQLDGNDTEVQKQTAL